MVPKIEIVLVENPEMPALGGGEPPIIAMGAALANAIFDAVGVRVVQLADDAGTRESGSGKGLKLRKNAPASGRWQAKARPTNASDWLA